MEWVSDILDGDVGYWVLYGVKLVVVVVVVKFVYV